MYFNFTAGILKNFKKKNINKVITYTIEDIIEVVGYKKKNISSPESFHHDISKI